MTVARNNIEPVLGDAASPLAARLDQLIRRIITVEQFEAEMVRWCAADPEEIWDLLGLLDRYHRLEKLPTELFRSLKAAADRYGLVRREPYLPNLSPTPKRIPTAKPAPAVAPTAAAATALPRTPVRQPAAPILPMATAPLAAAVANVTPDKTPFRHLLNDAPTSNAQHALEIGQGTWQGSRYAPPGPPARRSRLRPLVLSLMLLLSAAVAAGIRLNWWPDPGSLISRWGDVGNDAATPPPMSKAAPTAAPPAPPADAPATAPETAGSAPALAPPPSSAPAAAVATPGAPSIEFAADYYTVPPGDSAARLVVRRSGNLHRKLDFVWWTENASAIADVDYISWGRRTASVPAGQSSVTLLVPIINDSTRTGPRRFQVDIGSPDDGTRLGANTHATVQVSGTD